MRRRGLVVGLAVFLGVVAVAAAGARVHAVASTPYDGLVFRARAVPTTRQSLGWNDSVTCPDGVRNGLPEKTVSTITPATVTAGAGGAQAVSANVRLTYDGDRLVGFQGAAQVAISGDLRQLDLIGAAFKPQCTGFAAVGASAVGTVYPFSWSEQVCDNTACTVSHQGAAGTGCVAATQQAGELVTTIELGPCTPSAFPTIPPLATVSARKGLLDGLLIRVHANSGAYSFRNDCGSQLFLNRYSTWTEVLRPAAGLTVSSGSQLSLVPIIFTVDGNAKNWAGAVTLGLKTSGSTRDAVAQSFALRDFPQAMTPKGWGCRAASAHSQPLSEPLPVYVRAGNDGKTFVGRAWILVLGKDGQTADSHTGGAWSALIAFGRRDFTAR